MELETQETNGGRVIVLPAELSISTVADIRKALEDAGALSAPVTLNLEQVIEIDTAGLQLLLALKAKSKEAGHRLRLANHSFAVLRLVDLSGTAALLGDRLVVPANRRAELPFKYGTKLKAKNP